MKALQFVIPFCVAVFVLSCAAVKVDYDYDPEADFARLKSYGWFAVPHENVRHDLLTKQIKSEIKKQLQGKGFRLVTDDPDFFIALHGGFQSSLDYTDWQYLYEYYQPYWAKRRIDVTEYEDKQLIVDVIDRQSKELIFRAKATAFIPEPTLEKREKTIHEAITKILVNFPPDQSIESSN